MKKEQRFLRFHILFLLTFLCMNPTIYAAVTWDAVSVVSPVIDQDLILDGSLGQIILNPNDNAVIALTTNITITLANNNVELCGNNTTASCLYLFANNGYSITLDITGLYDLTFLGSANLNLDPLTIITQGQVNILLAGGRTLTLGSDGTNNGATECYVTMLESPDISDLSFNRVDRNSTTSTLDANVIVDTNCVLSYASEANLVSNGSITFCPTNKDSGRTLLTIQDKGSVVIQGSLLTVPEIGCQTVDRTIPSGNSAIFNIGTGQPCNNNFGLSPHTFLTIENKNEHYPELLSDPFFTLGARTAPPFTGTFNGLRYGCVLGAQGVLNINANAYLDYVGLSNNTLPDIDCIPGVVCSDIDVIALSTSCPCDSSVKQFIKQRNPSAFIVDGWYGAENVAQINLDTQSGFYFRSGINALGIVEHPTGPNIYTITPASSTAGSGEIVFDVEGPLNITGSNNGDTYNSRMEILSLEVSQALPMGPLFPDPGYSGPSIFPVRTFAVDINDFYRQYNKSAWLINNVVTMTNNSIGHTDELHLVCPSNDAISEATYLGGETWLLGEIMDPPVIPVIPRPNIQFFNSRLHLYTSAAFTGFDLEIPDLVIDSVEFANLTKFVFYSNGRVIDNGTGRILMLGTLIGSQAADNCTVINRDAHLDVIQLYDFNSVDPSVVPLEDQQLWFTVSTNTNLITEAIGSNNILGQTSIHEVYLGGDSNHSIGENSPSCESGFDNSSTPASWIASNFFTFNTRGGIVGIPETSNITGKGGIFVDYNGRFGIQPSYIASIGAMVTKSCNGLADLPKNQVVFDNRVGVSDWQLQMTGPETIIIPAGSVYSDYTLDWISVVKDFASFTPYEIGNVNVCSCPPVTPANIASLPTIKGTVDQFQIVDSRIGDAASIMIDGGYVRELLWLSNCRPAEAAVAIVVLQNEGQLGINTAHRNVDSINTETTFGVNGVTVIANGNGRIDLNADMIVNNVCAILQGPDWTENNVLEFRADAERFIVVTSDGTLDLSSFTNGGTIRISENVRLIFEAGSRLILGSAVLEFNENASIEFERSPQSIQYFANLDATVGPINNALNPLVSYNITTPHPLYAPLTNYGLGLANTDNYRVRIMGTGVIRMRDVSKAYLGVNAFVGIETLYETLPGDTLCEIPTTNVTLEIRDGASWQVGYGNNDQGGSFQVGNVVAHTNHTVNFTLTLNGADATFEAGAGAFIGFGAGVVRPTGLNEAQSTCLADNLFNVGTITFNFAEGSLQHERIFDSNDIRSQSMVIGTVTGFTLNYEQQGDDPTVLATDNFGIYGGGNLFQLIPATVGNAGAVYLINLVDDGTINIPVTNAAPVADERLFAGLLASTDMLDNLSVTAITPTVFFNTMKVTSATSPVTRSSNLSTIAPVDLVAFRASRTAGRLGYVDRTSIGRINVYDIIDTNGASEGDRRARAYDIGTVTIGVNDTVAAPGPILNATQLQE